MNDKDKKAFDEWRNSTSTRLDIHDAWQAACEYKDKEQYIEGSIHESDGIKREMTWKESSDMMEKMYQNSIARLDREYKRIRELQTENKKLREALEFYANYDNWRKEFGNKLEYNAHRIKDDFTLDENFTPYGGKRAREALKQTKEEL